jgi:hypothetical protein
MRVLLAFAGYTNFLIIKTARAFHIAIIGVRIRFDIFNVQDASWAILQRVQWHYLSSFWSSQSFNECLHLLHVAE